MRTLRLSCVLMLTLAAQGQGFINLNFEASSVPPSQPPSTSGDPSSWVTVSAAFPGWSAFLGTNQASTVLYNNETIGSVSISLLSTNAVFINTAIEGRFSVLLQAGLDGGFVRTEASLRQTGLIPADAQSIQFKAVPSGPFGVSIDGQTLSLTSLQVAPGYILYGANIATFAGSSRELRFTANEGLNNLNLDSIFFSNQPIPEPSVFGLFGLGALLFGWRFFKRKS